MWTVKLYNCIWIWSIYAPFISSNLIERSLLYGLSFGVKVINNIMKWINKNKNLSSNCQNNVIKLFHTYNISAFLIFYISNRHFLNCLTSDQFDVGLFGRLVWMNVIGIKVWQLKTMTGEAVDEKSAAPTTKSTSNDFKNRPSGNDSFLLLQSEINVC